MKGLTKLLKGHSGGEEITQNVYPTLDQKTSSFCSPSSLVFAV